MNIGIQAGYEPASAEFSLSQDSVRRLAAIGCEVAMTVYAQPPGQNSLIVLALLPLLAAGRASLRIGALIGDVIAADARFNIWCGDQKGRTGAAGTAARSRSEEWWLALLEGNEAVTNECLAAVQAFLEKGDHNALAEALTRTAAALNQRPD